MSKMSRTLFTSLHKNNKRFSLNLHRSKKLLVQNDNVKNFGTIQKLTKNTKIVSSVNFCKRTYCSNEQHVVKSPFGDIDIPDLKLHEYIWETIGPWEDKVAVVSTEK